MITSQGDYIMIKVGVLGIGNIAQKAYIPVYAARNHDVEWHLYSRSQDKLDALSRQYNFSNTHTDIDSMIASGIHAVFIHTPTQTHGDLIRKFLTHGIHVYVDKPISEDIHEVKELVALAQAQSCILMTGFNRRMSPIYQQQKNITQKNMILVQKHREHADQDVKFALFDMMIHVVDTLVYLMDTPIVSHHIRGVTEAGILSHAHLELHGDHVTGMATINMHSGGRSEVVEVMSPTGFYRCVDMNELLIHSDQGHHTERFGDWVPTLEKRGFVQIVDHFIECVKTGKQSDIFTLDDALITHQLVHDIYETIKEKA